MASTLFEGQGKKRLFLLDGMALIYRAHFALVRAPRFTSQGVNTSALFGYAQALLQILEEEGPTHIAVAFDTAEPTQRHLEFPEYKAQREEMPEDIGIAIPHVFRLMEAFRISLLTCPGYEADDIIGTLAKRANAAGFLTYMVTPDKDFGQLVSEKVFLYKPGRGSSPAEILGIPEILERWGIEKVEQVIDVLGLSGDASDNIPGIPGIGEKTAQKLIAQFGSVENVIAHASELKGKLRQNVEAFADQARLSKKLATILCDSPVAVELENLKRQQPNRDQLKTLLAEFEFMTLGKRLFGESFVASPRPVAAPPPPSKAETEEGKEQEEATAPEEAEGERPSETAVLSLKTIAEVPHNYQLVDTPQKRSRFLALLKPQPSFCLDSETTGLNVKSASLVGLAFSFQAHEGYYVPMPGDRAEALALLEEFRPVFENPDTEKVGHNLKYDLSVLRWHGILVNGKLFDTMLAHCLVAPEMRHGMDHLSQVYLGYAPIPITALIGEKEAGQISMRDVPVEKVAEYSAEDADVTWQLRGVMEALLREKNAEQVFFEVESPLIPALVEMEYHGITLDVGALKEYSVQLSSETLELEAKIFKLAGAAFNINSPKQLGELFFDVLKLDTKARKTRTGQYATDEQVLLRLAGRHEIARLVLEYRECKKLKSTYVDALPGAVFPGTGRVHTTYNQAVTATGRMQSQDPNLQNIPVRAERGREVRKAFIPRGREGEFAFFSADYSQIELRIIAELSQDPVMLAAFLEGQDVHGVTASRVYGVPSEQVTPEMRRKAKMVNFGIIYGISAFGLSQRLNISRFEAAEIIDNYFREYSCIKDYIHRTIELARKNGYVETMTGRRRYLRDIDSRNATLRSAAERNAINSPIQGTAADMIKIAMSRIHRRLLEGGFETKMLLQVHDELVFDLARKEKEKVLPMVEEAMKSALPMKVPIVVEMALGKNWLEAH